MPLYRRLPKRGFHNLFRKEYAIVNVASLTVFAAGSKVGPEELMEKGIIKKPLDGVKILGTGDLPHAIHVRAHKISKSAADKLQKAGGTFELIAGQDKTPA
jgi:large subunit ribosomal protein L15